MRNQVKLGAILSYLNILVTLIIGLIYTPVMLKLLGQSEYGLYSLVAAFAAYLNVLDMGLGNTIIRYLSKNRVDGDKEKESIYNAFFLVLYLIIGIATFVVGYIMNQYINDLFCLTLSSDQLGRIHTMFLIIVISLAVSFPLSVFTAIISAYERFAFIKMFSILQVILNPIIALPFLYYGYGAVSIVVISCILNIACLIINMYYCVVKLNVSFLFKKMDTFVIKEMVTYSFFIFLNYIMDKVYWNSGQFILGIISGTLQVAVYALAMQFMNIYIKLSIALSGVLLPKITMMVSNNVDVDKLTELMIKIGRLQYIIVAYILFMFTFIGNQFILLWVGSGYEDVYIIVIILMIGMFVPLIQNTGILILQAMNLNRYRMTVYTVIACIDFLVCFPMAKWFGGIGCAIVTSVSLILSTGIIINRYYYKRIHINIFKFWHSIFRMSKPILITSCIVYIVKSNLSLNLTWHSFLVESFILSAAYMIALRKYALNEYEKDLINKAFYKIKDNL